MRSRQRGAVAFVVIVAIIAAVAYWQRNRIAALFSRVSSLGAPPAAALEVSGVDCTIYESRGEAVMSGMVKNISGEPLSLAMTAVWTIERFKPMYHYAPVVPASLPAGGSTKFEIRGVLPPGAKGTCKMQAFTDRNSGKPVGFR